MQGHYWTLRGFVENKLRPPKAPPAQHFRAPLKDAKSGCISVTGRLRHGAPGCERLLVIVHGLGGSDSSGYVMHAAAAAEAAGWASLRMNLRGADRRGEDYYHAGLTADLRAALQSPQLRRYKHIALIGYSLGGHVVLSYAADAAEGVDSGALPLFDERIFALASVCAPVNLLDGAAAIDRSRAKFYRDHLLRGLKDMYREVSRRQPGGAVTPIPVAEAMGIRSLQEWDDRIVARRHNFDSGEHYYRSTSVGPRLPNIALPTLFLAAEADPMVRMEHVSPSIDAAPNIERHVFEEGGHVGFPQTVPLGPTPLPLEAGVIRWFEQRL